MRGGGGGSGRCVYAAVTAIAEMPYRLLERYTKVEARAEPLGLRLCVGGRCSGL